MVRGIHDSATLQATGDKGFSETKQKVSRRYQRYQRQPLGELKTFLATNAKSGTFMQIGELTPQEIDYCRIYLLNGRNATRAAMEAFGLTYEQGASKSQRLMSKPSITSVIQQELERSMQRLRIDSEWVLREAVEVYQRCMQTEKLIDRNGNHTGEFKFDASNALKALNLIGAHCNVKAFEDRSDSLKQDQIMERLKRARVRTGADNKKTLQALKEALDSDDSEDDEVSFMEPPDEDATVTIDGECLSEPEPDQREALKERLSRRQI